MNLEKIHIELDSSEVQKAMAIALAFTTFATAIEGNLKMVSCFISPVACLLLSYFFNWKHTIVAINPRV